MANQEQLEILKQGVDVWNKWREENKGTSINLRKANLKKIKLRKVNLINADLRKAKFNKSDLRKAYLNYANLSNADLSNANLSNADLSNAKLLKTKLSNANLMSAEIDDALLNFADLSNADLSYSSLLGAEFYNANLSNTTLHYADLRSANLSYADLRNAKLTNADLGGVNFFSANLSKANFFNCIIRRTIFGLTNLSSVKALETVRVGGECTIDFQTLRNSRDIPKSFLLRIGLPENYIHYLPDFYDEAPIRMFPVFLSHSWANKNFASKLYDALIKKGVLVWYDEKKLKPGDKIFEGISKSIYVYDKMILICSKQSLEKSWWVDQEMERIFKKERQYLREKGKRVNLLIPITIDDHIYQWQGAKGESIRDKVIGDFTNWENDIEFEKSLNQLLASLNVDRDQEERLPPSFLPK